MLYYSTRFGKIKNTRLDFSTLGSKNIFLFSGNVPSQWSVEYVSDLEAINIYKTDGSASSLEHSQIFIRYFKANKFLTLGTVDILNRSQDTIGGHEAVRYEIVKKSTVANFVSQPSWRSQRHTLIDIRYSNQSPTYFYVFAKNPDLPQQIFEDFINSLIFYSDAESFPPPLDKIK